MSRILLVNDCKFESTIMKDMLSNLGYEVHIADEYDALLKTKELSPNILICNLVMKETEGNFIIEKVKRIFPQIKCFLSSSSNIDRTYYLKYKVDDVIKTPVNIEGLRGLLEPQSQKINFCPYCGKGIDGFGSSVAFCPFCGGKIN